MAILEKTRPEIAPRIIRDKGFARRLEQACENHPQCPTDEYRGKKKWLYDRLSEEFGINVSPEAVRKWFTGETRPRPKAMNAVARLLEVDEAWLSLGTVKNETTREKKARNALASGAVNLVAGLIQMNGGHIAFPEGADTGVDIFAIIGGKQHAIQVKALFEAGPDMFDGTASLAGQYDTLVMVVQDEDEPLRPRLLVASKGDVEQAGDLRGDFYEFAVERRGPNFLLGKDQLPEVKDFRYLNSMPTRAGPTKGSSAAPE